MSAVDRKVVINRLANAVAPKHKQITARNKLLTLASKREKEGYDLEKQELLAYHRKQMHRLLRLNAATEQAVDAFFSKVAKEDLERLLEEWDEEHPEYGITLSDVEKKKSGPLYMRASYRRHLTDLEKAKQVTIDKQQKWRAAHSVGVDIRDQTRVLIHNLQGDRERVMDKFDDLLDTMHKDKKRYDHMTMEEQYYDISHKAEHHMHFKHHAEDEALPQKLVHSPKHSKYHLTETIRSDIALDYESTANAFHKMMVKNMHQHNRKETTHHVHNADAESSEELVCHVVDDHHGHTEGGHGHHEHHGHHPPGHHQPGHHQPGHHPPGHHPQGQHQDSHQPPGHSSPAHRESAYGSNGQSTSGSTGQGSSGQSTSGSTGQGSSSQSTSGSTGQGSSGQSTSGSTGQASSGQTASGSAGQGSTGQSQAGQGTSGDRPVGQGFSGHGPAGHGPHGHKSPGHGAHGHKSPGHGPYGHRSPGHGAHGRTDHHGHGHGHGLHDEHHLHHEGPKQKCEFRRKGDQYHQTSQYSKHQSSVAGGLRRENTEARRRFQKAVKDVLRAEQTLNCGYLRLTHRVVDELQEVMREHGKEMKFHKHMTDEELLAAVRQIMSDHNEDTPTASAKPKEDPKTQFKNKRQPSRHVNTLKPAIIKPRPSKRHTL